MTGIPQSCQRGFTKLVKLYSVENGNLEGEPDKEYPLFNYDYCIPELNYREAVSIPARPENAVFYEQYRSWTSPTPYKLFFKLIGTDPDSGETCWTFNHYKNVIAVEFSRQFATVQSIFQITSQLPSCAEVKITLTQNNIFLSGSEINVLHRNQYQIKTYLAPGVRKLAMMIKTWSDPEADPNVSPETTSSNIEVNRAKLKLKTIIIYAKQCFPSLAHLQILIDGETGTALAPSAECSKLLSNFRDKIYELFPADLYITWGPHIKRPPNIGNSLQNNNRIICTDQENESCPLQSKRVANVVHKVNQDGGDGNIGSDMDDSIIDLTQSSPEQENERILTSSTVMPRKRAAEDVEECTVYEHDGTASPPPDSTLLRKRPRYRFDLTATIDKTSVSTKVSATRPSDLEQNSPRRPPSPIFPPERSVTEVNKGEIKEISVRSSYSKDNQYIPPQILNLSTATHRIGRQRGAGTGIVRRTVYLNREVYNASGHGRGLGFNW